MHLTFPHVLFLSILSPRLRALSGGGGGGNSAAVASPPLSPALPKYKLADYRYGREEMLALYVKDNKVRVNSVFFYITYSYGSMYMIWIGTRVPFIIEY